MNRFYKDENGNPRKCGIFAPGLDRFILIDDLDHWMVLETAEILSSKIPTMVYILPALDVDINNSNCLNYTLYNKTEERIGSRLTSIGRQNPALRILHNSGTLACDGLPNDYQSKEKQEILSRLQQYAQYVLKQVYAINMAEVMCNPCDNKNFLDKYVVEYPDFKTMVDRSTTSNGVFNKLRNVLYLSTTIEEAEQQIINVWLQNYHEQEYMLAGYYRLLDQPVPDELKDHTEFTVIKLQQYTL
jgi:hypothetical protein